jgi:hypothetical protein
VRRTGLVTSIDVSQIPIDPCGIDPQNRNATPLFAGRPFVSTGFADSGRKQPAKPRNASAEKKSAAPAGPTRRVVVILKSRGERVTIYSTAGKGPAFSIVSADGKTLAKEISLKELQAGYPSYYELYRTSYVNVWAGLPSASHRAGGAIAR